MRRRKSGDGQEIGVEDGDEFARGGSSGLRPARRPCSLRDWCDADSDDRQAQRLVALHAGARDLLRFVGGIVEHLNIEQFARIVEARDGVDQPLDHVALVVDRKLYGNLGPPLTAGGGPGTLLRIDVVIVDQPVAVQSVGGQDHQHEEIRNHDREIECIRMIDAGKRAVGQLMPILTKGRLCDENACDGEQV